ncbi:hypothetical protein [Halobellus rufus]|uniref:hypothetical protein n=1 Tax=Halobellus rufus TaxID=1448860 RepID=UPI0009E051CE|nr:hypothetical protein [Halobellus rufus]
MAISRRNILIGLGALVGGGGALVSTGAFSTVSAERSVEVSTAGDASAFLTITGDEDYVADDSDGGVLTIDLGGPDGANNATGFNQNAVTTITGVVEIANNSADGTDATIGVSTSPPSEDPTASGEAAVEITDGSGGTAAVATFYAGLSGNNNIGNGSTPSIETGESAVLDVTVDTTDDVSVPTDASSGTLTIVADESNN